VGEFGWQGITKRRSFKTGDTVVLTIGYIVRSIYFDQWVLKKTGSVLSTEPAEKPRTWL
jgi:hypothetical protein